MEKNDPTAGEQRRQTTSGRQLISAERRSEGTLMNPEVGSSHCKLHVFVLIYTEASSA